jgi:hypothetical protein
MGFGETGFEVLETGFGETGFEALETGFEAGYGQQGLRCSQQTHSWVWPRSHWLRVFSFSLIWCDFSYFNYLHFY